MRDLFRKLLSVVLCLNIVGCTSLHVVQGWPAQTDAQQRSSASELSSGDRLLLTTDETTIPLVITAIEDNELVGFSADRSQVIRVPFAQIQKIERREYDMLPTILSVAGFLAVLGAILSQMPFVPG